MAVAMSTSAIVASLFPSTVRDQILKDAQEEVKLRMSDKTKNKTRKLHRTLRKKSSTKKGQESQEKMIKKKTRPIADLFPGESGSGEPCISFVYTLSLIHI